MKAGRCERDREVAYYKRRIDDANLKFLTLLGLIDNADPDALIILASDHGPHIANQCKIGNFKSTYEEIEEAQKVLLAIKWDDNYDGRYDKDIKSSANLFRYILSYLSKDEVLLGNKVNDDKVYMSIQNGDYVLPPKLVEYSR
jgi:hypothetical protein